MAKKELKWWKEMEVQASLTLKPPTSSSLSCQTYSSTLFYHPDSSNCHDNSLKCSKRYITTCYCYYYLLIINFLHTGSHDTLLGLTIANLCARRIRIKLHHGH
jgi:hypothetical protein